MKSKICTDVQQSKKLLELGLSADTADMFYFSIGLMPPIKINVGKIQENVVESKRCWAVPCWSLSTLLELMPKLYEEEDNPDDDGCQPNLCKGWDNDKWHIVYRSSIYITQWHDNPLDAAFEMVCWLLEQGHIKKEE